MLSWREYERQRSEPQPNRGVLFQVFKQQEEFLCTLLRYWVLFEVTCRCTFSMAAAVHHLGGLPVAPLYR